MNTTVKFLFSTLVAAAAMTSTAWAEGTTVTVSSADEINGAIKELNPGETLDLGEVAYEYKAPLTSDANMATIEKAGAYTIKGGKGALINYEIEVNPKKYSTGEFILDLQNAHLTMTKLTLRENATLSLTDSRLDYNGFQNGSAYLSVYSNSKLIMSNSILGYDPHKTGIEDPEKYTHTGTNQDFFGPRVAIYGSAEILNSTIYTGPGQGTNEGFNILGNGTGTITGSTLHTNLLSVGGCGLETTRLTAGTDSSNLSASLTLNNVKVDNIQYRGDYHSYSGVVVGTATESGILNITNGSQIDMTVIKHSDVREQGLSIGKKGTVNISDSSVTVVKTVNNGILTVSGNSKIVTGSYSGNAVQVVGDTTLTDSTIGGKVSFGYNQYLAGGKTLTFEGSNKIGTLYIGNKINVASASPNYTNGEKHEMLVKGDLSVGTLNNRATSVTTVEEGATLTVGDTVNRGQLIIKGSMVVDTTTAGAGTGHFEVNEDDTDSASASLTLDGGSFTDASSGGYIAIGANGGGSSTDSAAYMELKNNASFTTVGSLYLADGANNRITINDSTLTAGTITNAGTITADKTSEIALINGGSLAGTLKSDGEVTLGWDPTKATTTYVDATLNVAGTLDANQLYVYVNSELAVKEGGSLNSNYFINWGEVSATNAGSFNVDALYLYGRETLEGTNYPAGDQLGKLTLTGTDATIGRLQLGRVDDSNNSSMGNATVTLTDSSLAIGMLAHGTLADSEVQMIVADNTSKIALINGGSLAGTLKSDGAVTLGWDSTNATTTYVDATLNVAGTLDANQLYVYVNSELAVKEGGSLNSNYFINWGEVSATNAKGFNVDALYLYGRETLEGTNYPAGDQLGKLTLTGTDATIGRLQLGRVDDSNNSSMGNATVTLTDSSLTVGTLAHGSASGNETQAITLNNSTLKVTGDAQLSGVATLTVDKTSVLTVKVLGGEGDIYLAGTINVLESLKADNLTIVEGAVLNVGAANGVMLAAEISAIDFNTLTIVTDGIAVGESFALDQVLSGSGADDVWSTLDDNAEVTIVDTTSNTSYTGVYSKNNSSITVIPEPSMFGLFAGLGALLLVGARRRRK